MNIRQLALAAAAAAILSPAISNASPETTALNACARAFATSLASAGAAAPVYKVVYGGDRSAASAADFFVHTYTFDLHAKNQRTGLPVARANCSTDLRGSVIALRSVPTHALTLDFQN